MTVTAFAPRLEIAPPDLAPYRDGNTGVPFVTRFTSNQPGPRVVINALIHGNELCGALALEALFRLGVRPHRGTLTLCFANTAACLTFDPARPLLSRYIDEDMNRVWSAEALGSSRDTVELRRARQLRPIYEEAEILLDLHSMQHATAPLVLCGRMPRARALAFALGFPEWVVSDSGHAAGRRLLDYGHFADPDHSATALLVECGQHWRRESVAAALWSCLRLLHHLDMIPEPSAIFPAAGAFTQLAPPQRYVDVTDIITARDDSFRFTHAYGGLDVIPEAGTVIGYNAGEVVRTPYDNCVLIMPARRVRRGQTVVRLGRLQPAPVPVPTSAGTI